MSVKKQKTIVELWGLPGVGKTTLGREFAANGYQFIASGPRKMNRLKLCALYPLVVLIWCTTFLVGMTKGHSIQVVRYNVAVFFDSLEKIHCAKKSIQSLVVIDEGMVQRILSIADIVTSDRYIHLLLRWCPIGDITVLVADREVTKDRYSSDHPRVVANPEAFASWKQAVVAIVPVVTRQLHTLPGVNIVKKDSNETLYTDITSIISNSHEK